MGVTVVCVILPLILVLSTIHRHPKFSPIDESAHFDYVTRVYDHGVPRFGDRLLRSSLEELSCRGTRLEGMNVPACGTSKPYNRYPGGAYQYEAQQPPLYYLVASPLSSITERVFGVSRLTAARAVGAILLTMALLLLWRVSKILLISRVVMLGTLFAIAASPNVVYYSSIVSNDAPGLFWGAVAALLGATALKGRPAKPWLASLAAVGAALTKASCVLPFGIVGLLLLGRWWFGRGGSDTPGEALRRDAKARNFGLAMVFGSVVGVFAWIIFYRLTATLDPRELPTFEILRSDAVTPWTILGQARSFFSILTDAYTPFSAWNTEAYLLAGAVVAFAVVAALSGGAFTKERSWWASSGPVILVGLYVGGIAIGTGIWLSYDVNPGVSARYALPMVPLVGLVASAGIQRRRGQIVYVGGCAVFAFFSMWMIFRTSLA
jgi:hypothetical protein